MTLRSQMPSWQRVAAAYRLFGLEPLLDDECAPHGFVYANRLVALGSDHENMPGLALHDLAHYLTAPKSRQAAPNFGLGEHPQVDEPGEAPLMVSVSRADHEEAAASQLNVEMACAMFGEDEAESVRDYLNCIDYLCYVPNRGIFSREFYQSCLRHIIPRWASHGIRVFGSGRDVGHHLFIDDASVREILRPVL